MGLFIVHLYWNVLHWPDVGPGLVNLATFVRTPQAEWIMVDLFGVAVAGGMFVVPLYAFLTTTVHKSEPARTVAANTIDNSGGMVLAAVLLTVLVQLGVSVVVTLLMVSIVSFGAAWISRKLTPECN